MKRGGADESKICVKSIIGDWFYLNAKRLQLSEDRDW